MVKLLTTTKHARSCECCSSHEPHYCLLWSIAVRDTNITTCRHWEIHPDLSKPAPVKEDLRNKWVDGE
jgi:hypothetical protein